MSSWRCGLSTRSAWLGWSWARAHNAEAAPRLQGIEGVHRGRAEKQDLFDERLLQSGTLTCDEAQSALIFHAGSLGGRRPLINPAGERTPRRGRLPGIA